MSPVPKTANAAGRVLDIVATNQLSSNNRQRHGLYLLIVGSLFFILCGYHWDRVCPYAGNDFRGIYYGTRCLLHHADPYQIDAPLHIYQVEQGPSAAVSGALQNVFHLELYPPTTLFIAAPLALLSWPIAHLVWIVLTIGAIVLSACLVWDLAADSSPLLAGSLIAILLVNGASTFAGSNPAGIVTGLCGVAIWTFLRGRFIPLGIVCLAAGLGLKVHDAALVWLFFLLAGGLYRKRALLSLGAALILGIPGVLWVSCIAPHWLPELQANIETSKSHGYPNDPTRSSESSLVNLQTITGALTNKERIYDSSAYLVCSLPFLVWAITTLKGSLTARRSLFAFAAILPLSLLLVNHRIYDTKLLFFTVPACAALYAGDSRLRRPAVLITLAAATLTGEVPIAILLLLSHQLHLPVSGPGGIATLVFQRPVPFVLLAQCLIFLWAYVRYRSGPVTVPDPV